MFYYGYFLSQAKNFVKKDHTNKPFRLIIIVIPQYLFLTAGPGFKQWEPFSKGHLYDFLFLNVDRSQNVQYNQNRFTCHDVDFTLRLHSAGLLVCKFNNFSVMKKQIAIGGYKTFIIKTKVEVYK